MFERLTLTNFQTHRKLKVQLDPHVTTFIGPSDAGKSAILRALRWVCLNRPSGSAFVHHGTEFARVELIVDGQKVVRRIGGKNLYQLNDKKFQAFGASIPPQVSELLNVSANNFQGQHDAPFWFSQTPGQVSRELNQIINLGMIDAVMSEVSASLRKSRAVAEVAAERLDKALKQREALAPAVGLDESLRSLEGLFRDIVNKRSTLANMRVLVRDVQNAQDTLASARNRRIRGRKVVFAARKARELAQQVETLRELVSGLQQNELRHHRPIPNLKPLAVLWDVVQLTSQRRDKLRGLIVKIEVAKQRLREFRKTLWQANKSLSRLEKSDGKKRCPTCGQRIES